MAARVLFTQKGSDGSTIQWPMGHPQFWTLTSGTPLAIRELIGYGNGVITWPDGRQLPPVTSQGSTIIHQNG